jgi:uncharacterized protein (TIGR03083 family)
VSPRDLRRGSDQRFITVAATLTDEEWAAPSLCADWTNHEVLAHLVLGCSISLPAIAAAMIGHWADFDTANARLARDLAARRSPAALLADFAERSRAPRGIGRLFPPRLLTGDHVIHELDILLAVGREPRIPAGTLHAVLHTEVTIPNPFVPAKATAAGLRLHATDTGWTWSSGPGARLDVHGTAADLALALAGRPRALPRLTGSGAAELASRIRRERGTGRPGEDLLDLRENARDPDAC